MPHAQPWGAPGSCSLREMSQKRAEVGSWQVTQLSRAVRRDWDCPSVSLPALGAAPPRPSSSPAAPPARSGAAAARQDPWVLLPAAPAGPPARKDRKKTRETGWEKLLEGEEQPSVCSK